VDRGGLFALFALFAHRAASADKPPDFDRASSRLTRLDKYEARGNQGSESMVDPLGPGITAQEIADLGPGHRPEDLQRGPTGSGSNGRGA
jgi:hypothetical protein